MRGGECNKNKKYFEIFVFNSQVIMFSDVMVRLIDV
jgi:hypothetical protein